MRSSNHDILQHLDRLPVLLERFAPEPQGVHSDFSQRIAFRLMRQGQTNYPAMCT